VLNIVDIIIPVYNSNATLPLLLASIAMQTYRNIKVIIIDDCSSKSCKEILDNYSKFLNIKYIRLNENHGSGYARKIGIENSDSDYIVFADSDDTFLNAFSLEKMVQCIESDDYDFASFGFVQEHEDLEFSSTQCNATWIFSKIYSKAFLDKYNISFSSERFNEDVAFNQICYALADRVYKSNDTLYLHHMNENSVTKTNEYKVDDMNSFARNYLKAFEFVKSKKELIERIQFQFLDGFLILYHFYTEMIRTKEQEYCDSFFEHIKEYYDAIFDFAHILICSDDFDEHYFKIFNTHGIHNKKLICTLDWYTFLNNCEKARKEKLERNASLF
jgi:glycosyltransferase involved in cell wall biosynthesis